MSERVLPPGIERHGNRFRVVKKVHGTLVRRSFATLEEAKSFLADLRSRTEHPPQHHMKLYANHVVEAGQRELGQLAAAPWWG